eukprot:COSAG04_NODE_208_length_20334_cov_13.999852_15_plen_61_part_00
MEIESIACGSDDDAPQEPKVATMAAQSDEFCTDEEAEAMLAPALQTITDYYEARSIFQVI